MEPSERNVRISVYRKMHKDLVQFFKMEMGLVVFSDINGLIQTLSINHISLDWRLFIDSSKFSLKAIILHNSNTYLLFLLVIQCIIRSHMRKWILWWKLLITINSNCQICGDLKVIALLLGLKQGFTKYCCFTCKMGEQSSVSSLLKKGLAYQKIPGTRNLKRGKSTTSGTE